MAYVIDLVSVFVGTVTQEILPTSANNFDIKYYFQLVTSLKVR